MAKSVRALVASVVLVACGGSNDTLFVKGNGGEGGSDGGPSAGGARSNGGSSGNASGTGGRNAGGSTATGGSTSIGGTGGGTQPDGSTAAGGSTAPDGSADGSSGGAPDASTDSSTGGSTGGRAGAGGASTGGRGGAGGASTGGRGGAGGASTGGRGGAGTGGTGGAPGDAGKQEPTPGVIACAGGPCTIAGVPTNVCCSGGLVSSCLPSFPGCVQFGSPFACDDAADCATGNLCCRTALGASCAKTCGQTQLCRTDDECVTGSCRPLAQVRAYSACQ